MATMTRDFQAKYQVAKNSSVEETRFSAGEEVSVVQEWDKYCLIKNKDGHYYNVPKDKVQK